MVCFRKCTHAIKLQKYAFFLRWRIYFFQKRTITLDDNDAAPLPLSVPQKKSNPQNPQKTETSTLRTLKTPKFHQLFFVCGKKCVFLQIENNTNKV